MDKGNNNSRVEEFAKNINKFFGRIFIPFTTPFFALYNCYKLMSGVGDKHFLRILIFVVSMVYVVMSLAVAIYIVVVKGGKK